MPTNNKRLPRAGDFEKEIGMEVLYLSPRPLPTGMPAFSAHQLHRNANHSILDLSASQGNFEFMARIGIGSIMLITTSLLLFSAFASWVRRHSEPFVSAWMSFFFNPVIWLVILFVASLYLYYFLKIAKEISSHPPIRFNRERREVVYIVKKGTTPRYTPWESVIACVSSEKLITQYSITTAHKLMIGLSDTELDHILWNVIPCSSLSLAISEWEAIRSYMESGLTNLPEEVLDWSRPLPSDQHAKPSEELLHESAEVLEGFSNGQSLLDYLKVKYSNSDHCEEKNS